MKNTKKKIITTLKIFLLLLIPSLILINCKTDYEFEIQKEESQSEITFNKISLDEFISKKEMKKSLKIFSKKFDINKITAKNKNIIANDSSFVILTDQIIEAVQDSIKTYSFLLESCTDSTSTFENFIIRQVNNDLKLGIFKYKYNNKSDNDFPYEVTTQTVTEEQINLEDFDDFLKTMLIWDGNCLWISDDWDDNCSCGTFDTAYCISGGSGGAIGFTDSVGNNNNNNNETPHDGIDSNTGVETIGNTSSGSSNSSPNTEPAVGIIKKESYDQILSRCLAIPNNTQQGSNSQSNCMYTDLNGIDKKNLAKFMEKSENCGNEVASDFANQAIQAICDDDNLNLGELIENEIPCEKLNNLTNNAQLRVKLRELSQYNLNYNYEQAIRIKKNPSTNLLQTGDIYSSSNNDCGSVQVKIDIYTVGYIHSHPNSNACQIFGQFSGDDILKFALIAKTFNNGADQSNFQELTFMLTYDEEVFALKFDNFEAIQNLIAIYDDKDASDDFKEKLFNDYINLSNQNTGAMPDTYQLQKALLNHLTDNNINISLFEAIKGNQGFVTDWQKKTVDNDNLKTTPCI